MRNFKKLVIASAVGLAMASGSAFAASVSSQLVPGAQQISDDSAETLINMSLIGGVPTAVSYVSTTGTGLGKTVTVNCIVVGCDTTDTTLHEGDRLRGIMLITSASALEGQYGGSRAMSSSGVNQLAAIFDTVVVSKSGAPGAFTFVFAPTDVSLSGFGVAGSAIVYYERPLVGGVAPFNRTTCADASQGGACEATVTTGASAYWYGGFNADTSNNFWASTGVGSDSVAAFTLVTNPTTLGFFNVSLDQLAGGTGPTLGLVPCTNLATFTVVLSNFCATGPVQGTNNVDTAYPVWDEVNTVINVIPEPGSLALLGLGLGLGALGLRRRQA